MNSLNDLREILQGIKQKAKEQGLHIVQMQEVPSLQAPKLNWQGEWSEYLEVAGLVKAPLLYLQAEPFDLERQARNWMDTQTVGKILEMRGDKDDEGDWLFQRLMEQTEGWGIHQQQIGYIASLWFKEGLGHFLELSTNWYDDYDIAALNTLEEAEGVEAENRRVYSDEQAIAHFQRAKQLAHHQRFADASNDEKRLYMAAQLFPDLDEYGSSGLRHVISLAQAVYWWEVEPAERAAKEQRVRDLRAQGESIKNIAILLGMSEAKVRTAIQAGDSESN